MLKKVLMVGFVLVVVSGIALAVDIPKTINIQGVLKKDNQILSNWGGTVYCKIYDQAAGGDPIGRSDESTYQINTGKDGFFNIAVGLNYLPVDKQYWLEISGDEYTQDTPRDFSMPRQPLQAAPYAFNAFNVSNTMAVSDYYKIYGEGPNNAGKLIIETGDDKSEPIIFRQRQTWPPASYRDAMVIDESGKVGIGTYGSLKNMLNVGGGVSIGMGYATNPNLSLAPSDGLLVEGKTCIGPSSNPGDMNLYVGGSVGIGYNLNPEGFRLKVGGMSRFQDQVQIITSRPEEPVMLIDNTSADNRADGLMIRIRSASTANISTTAGEGNEFIGFYTADAKCGRILRTHTTNTSWPSPSGSTDNSHSYVSYTTSGSDYAEYFDAEEKVAGGELVGLNLSNGKVRKWQKGDPFVGIVSTTPGFIGNEKYIDKSKTSDSILVGIVGQIELSNKDNVVIENRIVKTSDGQKIGYLLSNGRVFISKN